MTNKLGLLPRREAAEAALVGAEGDARPEPLRGGGKSPNLFVKISGRALTFCKNLGATPNPEQANCDFTRRKRHIHQNVDQIGVRVESFGSFKSFESFKSLGSFTSI